jgi:predicted transcriptional regulator
MRHVACRVTPMERINITLEDEEAEKLRRLAERMHVQPGTIARSLLASALDEADPDARNIVELLDAIPGAYERAQLGLEQARHGRTIPLDEL